MRKKQLILLAAIMVLGLYGCKKKEPIETQPSIESITPTESEQELSSRYKQLWHNIFYGAGEFEEAYYKYKDYEIYSR